MGQQQSKDELLYRHAVDGNIQAISTLRRDGVSLEWVDREGKTPLIATCMSSERFAAARTLIELGADVNAYRPGHNAGTPLHHAASRGLDNIVQLLLFHGANALIKNDDSQTLLQVARVKGFSNVVRTIEDAQPRTVISLWRTNVEEPNFQQLDPAVIISDKSTKSQYKFASGSHGDKHQLHFLYKACIGVQVTRPNIANNFQMRVLESAAETAAEAMELARGISASIQSSTEAREPRTLIDHSSEAKNANGWGSVVRPTPSDMSFQGWGECRRWDQSLWKGLTSETDILRAELQWMDR